MPGHRSATIPTPAVHAALRIVADVKEPGGNRSK